VTYITFKVCTGNQWLWGCYLLASCSTDLDKEMQLWNAAFLKIIFLSLVILHLRLQFYSNSLRRNPLQDIKQAQTIGTISWVCNYMFLCLFLKNEIWMEIRLCRCKFPKYIKNLQLPFLFYANFPMCDFGLLFLEMFYLQIVFAIILILCIKLFGTWGGKISYYVKSDVFSCTIFNILCCRFKSEGKIGI